MVKLTVLEKGLIIIERYLPKNNILNCFLMIIRIIPLFLITHDWNIHYKYSITYYLSYITTLPIIHKFNAKNITSILVIIIFFYIIINIIIFFKFFKQLKDFNKVSNPSFFEFSIKTMFFLNFIISPYTFMICFENYFCDPIYDNNVSYKLIKKINNDCRDFGNYIIMIIQTIIIIYLLIVNFYFTYIISKPCSLTSSIMITKLNKIQLKLSLFPLFQAILVFDYYIPFKICVLIKSIVRLLFICYYIIFLLGELKNFYTNFNFRLFILFIDSMCFFSCIIEYIFLFNLNNNLIYLQENGTIIIFKLIIEAVLSFIVVQFFFLTEKKIIIQFFEGKIANKNSYELLNKIFFILNHPEKIFGTDLIYEIVEHFDTIFKNHKKSNKCILYPGIKCYCTKYTYKDFIKQSEKFLEIIKEIRNGIKYNNKILKVHFPIMYKYIENMIHIQIIKKKLDYENDTFYLGLTLFYIIFDKNYNKGLFYLEEFSSTKSYKINRVLQLQFKIIKNIILEDFQINLKDLKYKNTDKNVNNSFKGIYKLYFKISKVIIIENLVTEILNIYIESLNIIKEKDCSFSEFKNLLKKLNKSLKKLNKVLKQFFLSNIINSYHLCAKLTVFYSFFYLDLPKDINKCFKNIFEITCQIDNYSILFIDSKRDKNSWKFIIEYVSDNLCSKLGYQLNELKNKEINDYFPDSLKKCYNFNLLEKFRLGFMQVILKEVIFFNKKKHSILFDMTGIIVFDGNKLHLFFKVYDYKFKHNFHPINTTKSKSLILKEQNNKSNKNYNTEECFIFMNKNGKIQGINKLFEDYFSLGISSIKKHKINLLKDILKTESIENKNNIKKPLTIVYENISLINFTLMQNSPNDEYSNRYKKIKEFQKQIMKHFNSYINCYIEKREIMKNKREKKTFYFIFFEIELNNSYITFESFFDINKSINPFFDIPSQTKVGELLKEISRKKKNFIQNKFEINKNKNEILIKIRQIQILSIKYLSLNYNIKLNEIFDFSLKEKKEFNDYNDIVEKETTRLISSPSINSNASLQSNKNNKIFTNESIDNIDNFFHYDRKLDKLLKNKNYIYSLKFKIYCLIIIWILFIITVIILEIVIINFLNSHSKTITNLTNVLINSLITRNILYSFITSLLNMQYIANGLHDENVIDNGFTNTISYHKKKIYDRVRDFLYYFKSFEKDEKLLCDYNEIEVINIYFEELDYINVNSQNLTSKHSLNSILSNTHLNAFEVISHDIESFLFNISYDTIFERTLLDKNSFFQFVFDNYFCNGKYTWDEIDNLIYHHIKTKTNKVLIIIYLISITDGLIICIGFIFEVFLFSKFYNQIFAKYYLNYNYIQFFSNLLLKKANLVKDFISNTDIENLYKFNLEKISFENNINDNNNFKTNYLRINNNIPIEIKPYPIKEFISVESNNSSYTKFKFKESLIQNEINPIIFQIPTINYKNNSEKRLSLKMNEKSHSSQSGKKEQKNYSFFNNYKERHLTKKKKSTNFLNKSQSLSQSSYQSSTLNLLQELNNINTKKDLKKPTQYIMYIIFFSMSILCLGIFLLFSDLIIKKTLNTKIFFVYIIKNLIETINNAQEIFNIYAITLLKGEKMIFKYKSHGYLNSYKELDYINKLEDHEILEEVFEKNDLFKSKVYVFLTKKKHLFQSLNSYMDLENSQDGCKFYTNFYYDNINNSDFSFLNAFNYNISELIEECVNISHGINLNGISQAIQSFLSEIRIKYHEFKLDYNREENLLKRVNDNKFIGLWMEINLIYDKIIINFIISWLKDLKNVEHKFDIFHIIVFSCIFLLLCLICVGFLIFFPINILNDNSIITKIEPCCYNNIIF